MNALEQNTLDLLIQNSRYSNADIAHMLNTDEATIETIIDTLTKSGVIRQFTTIVNDNLIKNQPIKALVELSIRPEKDTGYDAIANKINGFPNVISHYLVSGSYDFLLVVEGNNHKDIAHFVFDKLATIENVKATTTHFIFKSYKEQGVLIEAPATIQRVPLLP